MRLSLVVFVSFATLGFSAEQSPASKKVEDAPKPKIVAPAAPTPAPKRSVLGRIFGPKATPTPAPEPTPAPVVKPKPRPKPKPKADTEETPDTNADKTPPKPKKPDGEKPDAEKPDSEKPKPADKPADEKPSDKPAADKPAGETSAPATDKPAGETPNPEDQPPKPKGGKAGKNAKNTPKAAKPADAPNLDDATKYKNAHATALEDEKIKDLKTKADSAIDESEAHKASVAYNKALFHKIREIDGSIDGYVDKLEAAMMKRLDAEKH